MTKAEEVRELADQHDRLAKRASPYLAMLHTTTSTALRAYAALLEEREREERLLDDGWLVDRVGDEGGTLCWRWRLYPSDTGFMHPDRATAAKLAEEKMNARDEHQD